jgi:hypothetical protein
MERTMTDRLHELFDELLADEPPLRTSTDDAVAGGRRLRRRRWTLWTVSGATAVAALAVIVPTVVARPASYAGNSPSLALTASTTLMSAPSVVATHYCPGARSTVDANIRDGAVLPDPNAAARAVMTAAHGVAPGKQFIPRLKEYIATTPKTPGIPQVVLIFDVGDDHGFGSIDFQILPEVGPTPTRRADSDLSHLDQCVDLRRRMFTDGSVALYYPYGPPEQELETTHVWYYAAGGFTMNIGSFPQGWSTGENPGKSPPPPPLPVRTDQPLTIDQIMDLADAVAHAS